MADEIVRVVAEGEYQERERYEHPTFGLLDWVKANLVVTKTGPMEVTVSGPRYDLSTLQRGCDRR